MLEMMSDSLILALIALMVSDLPILDDLSGGRFGAAVVDLNTGEMVLSTGSGYYQLWDSRFLFTSFICEMQWESGKAFSRLFFGGLFPIKMLGISPEDTSSDEDVPLLNIYSLEFPKWMESIGLQSSISYTDAWDITLDTAADLLSSVYSRIDDPFLRNLISNPDMGDAQAANVAQGWDLYGWVDAGENHKSFVLIARSPQGRDLGLVLLSNDLCCEEKGDLAMMLLWQEAQGL
jgi:hypothetical protein